ncbi:MAG: hypothetical protein RR595_04280 [Lysinibacillus sp.]
MSAISRLSQFPSTPVQLQFHTLDDAKSTQHQQNFTVVTKVESGIFSRYSENEDGQRTLMSRSETKEGQLLMKRKIFSTHEELLQRLTYRNGIHYSERLKIAPGDTSREDWGNL